MPRQSPPRLRRTVVDDQPRAEALAVLLFAAAAAPTAAIILVHGNPFPAAVGAGPIAGVLDMATGR